MAKNEKSASSGYINHGVVAENRRAKFDYEILDTYEAGMQLQGTEVKSLRRGRANIAESYAGEYQGRIWLFGATIEEWEGGNRFNHEPRRNRMLLLKEKEIKKLLGQIKQKGLTLVPLKIYFNQRGYAKLLIGLGKGKRDFEKRETIKERDWQREQSALLKRE